MHGIPQLAGIGRKLACRGSLPRHTACVFSATDYRARSCRFHPDWTQYSRTSIMIKTRLWQIYDEVGFTACSKGDLDLAERMFNAAIDSCSFDKTMQVQRIKSLIGLADTFSMDERKKKEAAKLYNRAINSLARIDSKPGNERLMLAHALERLGYLLIEERRYEEALKPLLRSVRIVEKLWGLRSQALIPRLLKISYIYSITDRPTEAIEAFTHARAIQDSDQHSS
jgi:tetratricopeptide (TPR) repeat protein